MADLPVADEYLILDLRHAGDVLLWWAPDNCGYTTRIDRAGRYSRTVVEANLGYYNDGMITRAIPSSAVEAAAVRVVLNDAPWTALLRPARQDDDGSTDPESEDCADDSYSSP